MKHTLSQIQKILTDYMAVTEPELMIGFNHTFYELTVAPESCSLVAFGKKIEAANVSFEELFTTNHEILGVCLKRDWDNLMVFRCLPDLSEPDKVIERYRSEKSRFPNQQAWSEAVLSYCLAYLQETYEEKWIRFEPAEQTLPYFQLSDGSFLTLTYVSGLHGIVVETADNEHDAYNYAFEDADIIYEGFDRTDALRQLKDCIRDCWADYRKQVGQE